MIQIHDKKFEPSISEQEISDRIKVLASQVELDYRGKKPLFIAVLNGAFMFASDLLKELQIPCEIQFVKMSSYDGMGSTGKVSELIGLSDNIENRDVVLIEDIVDTGLTLERLKFTFEKSRVSSFKVISLLFKKDAYLGKDQIDYVGFEIPNDFVVGYGMDYDNLGRNLKAIYKLASVNDERKNKNMLNLVLFGPPGAGKGTQAEKLVEKYNLYHISTGDVFRYNMKNDTELGILAKSYIEKGNLVPDEVTINMLVDTIKKNPSQGYIFDGFPRTTPQADALDKILSELGTSIGACLALDVEEDELKDRLKNRALTSGRKDDAKPEVIQNRIQVYIDETSPLKGFYSQQEKFVKIDGHGSIHQISTRLFEAIDKL